MTQEQYFNDFYKDIKVDKIKDDMISVDLYHLIKEGNELVRTNNQHVNILFYNNKLIYTGDMNSFIFGNTIHNIFEFFKGSRINPGYWYEKLEASTNTVYGDEIDVDKAISFAKKEIDEICKDSEEFEIDSIKEAFNDMASDLESNAIRAYDRIRDMFNEIDDEYAADKTSSIIEQSYVFKHHYLYACELIQWVCNNINGWIIN